MLPRMLSAGLLAAALVAANGCCCSQPFIAHGSAVMDTCDDGNCGECASCGTHGRPGIMHGAQRAMTCGSGCGEMYWGDWLSYPPSCNGCDAWACESSCSPFHLFSGLRNLWGYRYRSGGCGMAGCDGGCDSCSAGYGSAGYGDDNMPMEYMPEPAGERLSPPKPAPEPAPERKATETGYRFRQATYAKQPARHASRPAKPRPTYAVRTAEEEQVQPASRISRDITR